MKDSTREAVTEFVRIRGEQNQRRAEVRRLVCHEFANGVPANEFIALGVSRGQVYLWLRSAGLIKSPAA